MSLIQIATTAETAKYAGKVHWEALEQLRREGFELKQLDHFLLLHYQKRGAGIYRALIRSGNWPPAIDVTFRGTFNDDISSIFTKVVGYYPNLCEEPLTGIVYGEDGPLKDYLVILRESGFELQLMKKEETIR